MARHTAFPLLVSCTEWIGRRTILFAALGLVIVALSTASMSPLFDPDEGYYAATAAESVDAGHWWDLEFNGEPRWEKPILGYALIEGAFALFGRSATSARIPSAIEGAALVLLVGALTARLAGRRPGRLSALILATTLGVQVFARAAHPEIAVVLSIAVTQLLLTMWLVLPRHEWLRGLPVLIGLSLGYGVLAKGPVAVAVPMLGFAGAAPFVMRWKDRWRELFRDGSVAGAVALAVAAPWYAVMTAYYGTGFLRYAIWYQNVSRYTGHVPEHHDSAALFVCSIAIGLLPWTGLLPAATRGLERPLNTRRELIRFCVAASALASLVFYVLSGSKLASYSLALLPSLAVLLAIHLDRVLSTPDARAIVSFRIASATLASLALGLLTIPILNGRLLRMRDLVGGIPAAENTAALFAVVAPMAGILVVGAVLVWLLPIRSRIAALSAVGLAVPMAALMATRTLLADAYPWERFGGEIATMPGPVWIHTYRAPSLTFYAGRPVERIIGDAPLEQLLERANGWVIVEAAWETDPALAHRLQSGGASIVERTHRMLLVRLQSPAPGAVRAVPTGR